MITVLWILKGILTFVFLASGLMKVLQNREKVITSSGKWAEGFSDLEVKIIGIIEVVLALCLVVPKLLGHGYYLTSISAFGIAIVMGGAMYTHYKRAEHMFIIINLLFLLIALFIALLTCPLTQHWDYI